MLEELDGGASDMNIESEDEDEGYLQLNNNILEPYPVETQHMNFLTQATFQLSQEHKLNTFGLLYGSTIKQT